MDGRPIDSPMGNGGARRSRWGLRIFVAAVASILIIGSPWLGMIAGEKWTDSPIDRDVAISASIIAAAAVAVAWGITIIYRLMTRWSARDRRGSSEGSLAFIDDQELKSALLERHEVTCARCGYSLRGLSANVCPECREPIRLVVGTRIRGEPGRVIVWGAFGVCVLRAVAGSLYLWYFVAVLWPRLGSSAGAIPRLWHLLAIPVAYLIALVPMGVCIVRWLRATTIGDRDSARARVFWIAMAVIAADALLYLLQAVVFVLH
jgi:hypothetical protein